MNNKKEYNKCLPKQMYRNSLVPGVGCNKTKEECYSAGGPDNCIKYNDARIR